MSEKETPVSDVSKKNSVTVGSWVCLVPDNNDGCCEGGEGGLFQIYHSIYCRPNHFTETLYAV